MSRFPAVSARIDHILKTYYKEESRLKLQHMHAEISSFLSRSKLPKGKYQTDIDVLRLSNVNLSYFLDVIKYKEYHFNPKICGLDLHSAEFMEAVHGHTPGSGANKIISRAKAAAFTAKWLLRYMPISILPNGREIPKNEDEKWFITHANELFALDHCMGLMTRETKHLQAATIDDLLYHFKYRPSDDRTLILAFSILSRSQH